MAEVGVDQTARPRPVVLVFVHVPKTAGSTLRSVLNMNEPGARSKALGNVFKGGGGIDRGIVLRLRKDEGPNLRGVGLVRGHFPLGIREYLPNYLQKRKELHCFTFLREPVDRTLSHYFAVRDRHEGSDEPGKHASSALPPDASLDEALAGGYIHDNLHTRMLCGDPEPFGEVTEEMLKAAKRNLREELVFFGLTERFDESLVLAKRRLGLRGILYRSSGRVNDSRPRGDEVPAELRRAAERCNRYDIELYRHARELFEDELEPRDLEFEVELAALQAAKTDGELEVPMAVPESFGGDREAWRMLVSATAEAQRLEQKLAGTASRAAHDRARTRVLKQEVERRDSVPARMPQLEQEVERLRAASSRAEELEREVERLKAAGAEGGHRRAKRTEPKRDRGGAKRPDSKPARETAAQGANGSRKPGRSRSKRDGKPRRRKPRRSPEAARSNADDIAASDQEAVGDGG